MFINYTFDLPQCMRRKAAVSGKYNRIKPEFTLSVGSADVDVCRLATLIRVEVEPKAANAENCRHL